MNKLRRFPSFLINNNKALLVLSLVIAFIIWYILTALYNPISTTAIKNVPIHFDVSDTAVASLGLDVVEYDTDDVTVTISGKTVLISSVTASDLIVSPSLSSVTQAGTYELPLNVNNSNFLSDYEIVSISPSKVKVTFDQVVTKSFDVTAEAVGCTAAEDLVAELPVMTESSTKVLNVRGPKSDLERIDSVVARAEVNKELAETASFDADILLLDKDGNTIDSSRMQLGFRSANITVNISTIRTLPVRAVFSGEPADLTLSCSLSEKEVTVIGKPDVVKDMSEVTLEAIDCGQITPDHHVFERNCSLPSGVRVYDSAQSVITVDVNVSSYTTKTIKITNVTFTGLMNGLKANLQNATSVTVMGTKSEINAITASDVIVIADATGLGAGSGKQVNATVTLDAKRTHAWVVTYDKNYLVTFTLS